MTVVRVHCRPSSIEQGFLRGNKDMRHLWLAGLALFVLTAADNPPDQEYKPGNNMSISLSGTDGDELRGYWDKLSDGGTVTVPLEKQRFGRSLAQMAPVHASPPRRGKIPRNER